MNDTIAAILKQLRNESHISVKQAVTLLKSYDIDIASKTIYGYESGLSMPNADVFLALCQIYRSGSKGNAQNTVAEAGLEHPEKNTTIPSGTRFLFSTIIRCWTLLERTLCKRSCSMKKNACGRCIRKYLPCVPSFFPALIPPEIPDI